MSVKVKNGEMLAPFEYFGRSIGAKSSNLGRFHNFRTRPNIKHLTIGICFITVYNKLLSFTSAQHIKFLQQA
ncbi:hypothetical protein AGMMS50284_0600 [Clostridia bacterium]|nr:hypothetical protein AGMMS50284_0600 [Clostridia bacterium]